MKPTVHNAGQSRNAALVQTWHRPHLNALTHGLRSGSVLLPGDDVTEFRKLRQRFFHLHKPRTIAEALCVETITASHWRVARCRLEQGIFKDHLGAVMSGHPDATGYLCDPDPHRLHHRSTDCNKEERRLEKSGDKALATLSLLQKQRTQNPAMGNEAALEDYLVFLAEGEPVEEEAPEEAPSSAPTEGDSPSEQAATSGSEDGGIVKVPERETATSARQFPKHWSRRQREAAARRAAAT
jgi:hypothetical protein